GAWRRNHPSDARRWKSSCSRFVNWTRMRPSIRRAVLPGARITTRPCRFKSCFPHCLSYSDGLKSLLLVFEYAGITLGVSRHVDRRSIIETPDGPTIGFVGRCRPFLMVPALSPSNRLIQPSRFLEYGRIHFH